jgi:hypothetical protein
MAGGVRRHQYFCYYTCQRPVPRAGIDFVRCEGQNTRTQHTAPSSQQRKTITGWTSTNLNITQQNGIGDTVVWFMAIGRSRLRPLSLIINLPSGDPLRNTVPSTIS